MPDNNTPHPPLATPAEWLALRKELLQQEKALTRQYDALSAQRRRLPMVPIGKEYVFEGPRGRATLPDLFEGRRQLIIYHFMFAPEAETGCPGCTSYVDALGDLSLLNERDTTFALVSRAPLAKLEAYRQEHGWDRTWYSSNGSDFNYDFHVSVDEEVAPLMANFRTQEELIAAGRKYMRKGETHGLSVFFLLDGQPHHTYSAYARGTEMLTDAYALLDVTPYGRQEDFEDSPPGWPQKPTYG